MNQSEEIEKSDLECGSDTKTGAFLYTKCQRRHMCFVCIVNDMLFRQQLDFEEVEESSPRTPEKPPRLSDEQIIRRSLEVCLAWIKI